jgi:hypothetical protein
LIAELLLNCIKKLPIHDRWLLARQDFTLVFDLADIEPVAQQIEQGAAFEENASMGRTGCAQSYLCSDVFVFEIPHQRIDPAEFEVSPVDQPNPFGFVFDDGDLAVLHFIAEGQGTADPETLPLRGGNLVSDALGRDLPFELGEGQEHVEGQPAHGGSGIELLGDRHKRYTMSIEQFDQFGEVGQ